MADAPDNDLLATGYLGAFAPLRGCVISNGPDRTVAQQLDLRDCVQIEAADHFPEFVLKGQCFAPGPAFPSTTVRPVGRGASMAVGPNTLFMLVGALVKQHQKSSDTVLLLGTGDWVAEEPVGRYHVTDFAKRVAAGEYVPATAEWQLTVQEAPQVYATMQRGGHAALIVLDATAPGGRVWLDIGPDLTAFRGHQRCTFQFGSLGSDASVGRLPAQAAPAIGAAEIPPVPAPF